MLMKALSLPTLVFTALCILANIAEGVDYIPGSGWQQFSFSDLSCCRDPIFNDEGLFTFSVGAEQQPVLEVADLELSGERFTVYINGNWTSFTTSQPIGSYCGSNNPDNLSHGSWRLSAGTYSLRFNLGSWCVWSPRPIRGRFRVLILPEPIQPTTNPSEQVGCVGREASFRAAAKIPEPYSDPGESYQWLFNGTNVLAGETNSGLSLLNLSYADEGFYSCIISNQYGSVISPSSYLRVLDACVGLNLYAGLSITGVVGRTYLVEYVTNATETTWTPYATNTLTSQSWLFIDTNTRAHPKKFFRVRLQP